MKYIVFTGGPGAGKTSLLNALQQQGHVCVPESGRLIMQRRKAQGLSARPSPKTFAREMLALDIQHYEDLPSHTSLAFFDRSVLDALSLLSVQCQLSDSQIQHYVVQYLYHTQVFVAPPWSEIFFQDQERDQSFEESIRICTRLSHFYSQHGYTCITLPKKSIEQRVQFVLERCEEI
ncbi:MAG: AAA family ATPase [Myxococcota bacterium]